MNKVNTIIMMSVLTIIIAFLLGFSVSLSQKNNANTNNNIINIGNADRKKIDMNKSNKSELMSIKGIGDKKADLIIKNRPYKSIWDIATIDGISEDFIEDIREEVCVNAES
jgi:competence protein ComEA